ncbi:uncharacterized protein LOC112499870 [Cynara cardunculus var. scolymus]|uniref:uncharacterized protein LOC112499870 n=1 Tax=Cynara cardunculus var. scolymus TaxID=59895 RepID=UPI000D62CCAB|nr:uncharacterized protein LOC112499870 [Cynara cardunculus var. scolymus]
MVLNSSKQSLKSTSSNVEDNIPNSDRRLRSSSQRNNIPYHSENMDSNTYPQYEHTSIEHSSSNVTITNPLSDSSNEYLDHRDKSVICECYEAKLWRDEALRGKKSGMKTTIDSSINSGNAPYIYRLNGQNYHRMGSLLPPDGSKPKFSQLIGYINGYLQQISELHPSYLPLQYPLLFPYGEDGYKVDIPHREQFIVDGYTMIESERLHYIRKQQKVPRCETYDNLCNVQEHGESDASNIGQRLILPSSFTGGSRRDDGRLIEKSGVKLDNRIVVPYNKQLLKRYQAHINVEWCNYASSIKYLFKYINKGPDRATVAIVENSIDEVTITVVDEIKQYYDCRYLSACEASWRIFGYDVHSMTPSVLILPFHLPGQQQVVFSAEDDIENVLNRPSVASSMFFAWMHSNQIYQEARELTYVEFPTKFVVGNWRNDIGIEGKKGSQLDKFIQFLLL